MGAAPERKEQKAVVSPLRTLESRTELTIAHSGKPGPRRFARVPTHAVGVAEDRRRNPRASLSLPLRLTRIGEITEAIPVTLVTRNISSSGIYFFAPRDIEPGTAIELEVGLIDRPQGFGRVQMCTSAHIVRAEAADTPGWRGYAASFDDFAIERDDVLPLRYRQH
jgi:PilZ domain